jgi:hypothetical protein
MTDGGSRDDELMEALAAASRHDAVPPEVVSAAKEAFTWRTIDAELAELTFDSVADALTGVRGSSTGPRALTFEYDEVVVEVEVTEHAGRRTLAGHVAPSSPEWVEVHQAAGGEPMRVEADALGRFGASGIGAGPFRLLCRFRPDARPSMMLTEWVSI